VARAQAHQCWRARRQQPASGRQVEYAARAPRFGAEQSATGGRQIGHAVRIRRCASPDQQSQANNRPGRQPHAPKPTAIF
jgi:hypothetical protein